MSRGDVSVTQSTVWPFFDWAKTNSLNPHFVGFCFHVLGHSPAFIHSQVSEGMIKWLECILDAVHQGLESGLSWWDVSLFSVIMVFLIRGAAMKVPRCCSVSAPTWSVMEEPMIEGGSASSNQRYGSVFMEKCPTFESVHLSLCLCDICAAPMVCLTPCLYWWYRDWKFKEVEECICGGGHRPAVGGRGQRLQQTSTFTSWARLRQVYIPVVISSSLCNYGDG